MERSVIRYGEPLMFELLSKQEKQKAKRVAKELFKLYKAQKRLDEQIDKAHEKGDSKKVKKLLAEWQRLVKREDKLHQKLKRDKVLYDYTLNLFNEMLEKSESKRRKKVKY